MRIDLELIPVRTYSQIVIGDRITAREGYPAHENQGRTRGDLKHLRLVKSATLAVNFVDGSLKLYAVFIPEQLVEGGK